MSIETSKNYDILTDKNYPVVLSFMAVFGPHMELPSYPFELLEKSLVDCADDGRAVHRLLDYHYKLIRGLNPHYRNMNMSTIPKALQRYLPATLSAKLDQTEYSRLEPRDRLQILLTMLELQLNQNAKMRPLLATGNRDDLGGLRPKPAGRTIEGHQYWIFTDSECAVEKVLRMMPEWEEKVCTFVLIYVEESAGAIRLLVKEVDEIAPELERLYKQIRHRYPDFVCSLPGGLSFRYSVEDDANTVLQSVIDEVSYKWPLPQNRLAPKTTTTTVNRRSQRLAAESSRRTKNECCYICGRLGLLCYCSGCDYGWHSECLGFGADVSSDWFCDACEQKGLCEKLSDTLRDLTEVRKSREASKLEHEKKRLDRLARVSSNLDSLLRETESKAAAAAAAVPKVVPAAASTKKRKRTNVVAAAARMVVVAKRRRNQVPPAAEFLDPRSRRKKSVNYTFDAYDEAINEAVGIEEDEAVDEDAGDDGEWDARSAESSHQDDEDEARSSESSSGERSSDWSNASAKNRKYLIVSKRRSARIASKQSRKVYIEDDDEEDDFSVDDDDTRDVVPRAPAKRKAKRVAKESSSNDEETKDTAEGPSAVDIAWQRRVQLMERQRNARTTTQKQDNGTILTPADLTTGNDNEGFLIRDILRKEDDEAGNDDDDEH